MGAHFPKWCNILSCKRGLIIFTSFVGIGFGAYSAVDFALVMDVLPEEKDKAKDLAVWHQVGVFKCIA